MIVGIVLALVGAAGLATAAGPADGGDRTAALDDGHPAQAGQPAVGDQSAVAVTLDQAPDGVQRYNVTVRLEGPEGASLESASAGDVEGFEVRSQSDEAITFRAADLAENVQSGATDVSLGTVTVAGTGGESPDVTVATHDFRNDDSEQIDPSLSTEAASVDGGNAAAAGGGAGSGLADTLPGTPMVWAVAAVGFVAVLAVVAALRW